MAAFNVTPAAGSLAVTGYAPTVIVDGSADVTPAPFAIAITGHAPSIDIAWDTIAQTETPPVVMLLQDFVQVTGSSSGVALEVTRDSDGAMRFYSVEGASGKQADSTELTALAALTGATLGRSLVTAAAVSDIAAITTSSYRLDSEYGAPVRTIASASYRAIYSFTIPANTLGAVRLSLRGDLIQNATAKALKMKITLGGVDVWGAQASGDVAQDSDRYPWSIDLDLASTGTGTQTLSFAFLQGQAVAAGSGIGQYFSAYRHGLGSATPAADETTDLLLEVAFAWNGNTTSADVRLFQALLEAV